MLRGFFLQICFFMLEIDKIRTPHHTALKASFFILSIFRKIETIAKHTTVETHLYKRFMNDINCVRTIDTEFNYFVMHNNWRAKPNSPKLQKSPH